MAQLLVGWEQAGQADQVKDETLQDLLTTLVRIYAARAQERRSDGLEPPPPFGADATITATEVVVTTAAMLRAQKIAAFELAMWHY